MRAYELLESQEEDSIRQSIDRKIRNLSYFLNTFDERNKAVGFDKTRYLAIENIKANLPNFIEEFVAKNNVKIQKSLNNLNQLRQQLQNKIDTGI